MLPELQPDAVTAFIGRYVDAGHPVSDTCLPAFVRAYVEGTADDADRAALRPAPQVSHPA